MRAEPPSHAEPIPAMDKLNRNANGATIHNPPTRSAMCATACTIPCSTLMSCLLTATSNVNVAPIYSAPESTPPHATAPGKVFCGSIISSPMTEASSSPTRPKQITPNEFSTNRGFSGILKSAQVKFVPKRDHTMSPSAIKSPAAINVPTPPMLLTHLPTPNPTMFSTTKTPSNNTHAPSANTLLSARCSCPGPSTNTETPTKYSRTVGTYIMLLVQ